MPWNAWLWVITTSFTIFLRFWVKIGPTGPKKGRFGPKLGIQKSGLFSKTSTLILLKMHERDIFSKIGVEVFEKSPLFCIPDFGPKQNALSPTLSVDSALVAQCKAGLTTKVETSKSGSTHLGSKMHESDKSQHFLCLVIII